MNCTVCGAMIPAGQNVCPACGNPIAAGGFAQPMQPQQPMQGQQTGYQQPMQGQQTGYQQPMQPQQQMGYQQPMQGQQTGYQQPMQPQQQMGYQQPMQGQQMGYQQPMQPQQQMGYQQPMQGQQMGYQQPMQPQQQMGYQQPMGGYQQPMGGYGQPMGGGFGGFDIKNNLFNIISLAGAALLFFTPLFSWCTVSFMGLKESGNLFKIGGVEIFFGIMIMLLSAVIIAEELGIFVPAINNIKAKIPAITLILVIVCGVALLFVLLATIKALPGDEKDAIKAWGGKAHRSIGCWLAWISLIAAGCNPVTTFLKEKGIMH